MARSLARSTMMHPASKTVRARQVGRAAAADDAGGGRIVFCWIWEEGEGGGQVSQQGAAGHVWLPITS